MKKLILFTLISLGLGKNIFSKEMHKLLTPKVNCDLREIKDDIRFLLDCGYTLVPYTRIFENSSGSQKNDWRCFLRSPKGKCAICYDYLNGKFTTQ